MPSATGCVGWSPATVRRAPGADRAPRLRERSPVQVRTRSPSPARPAMVSRVAPGGRSEPHHLGEAARDQCGAGARAEVEAVADPGRDRDYVFDRAAKFDPDHVGAAVDAQRSGGEQRPARARATVSSSPRPPPTPLACRAPLRRRNRARRAPRSGRTCGASSASIAVIVCSESSSMPLVTLTMIAAGGNRWRIGAIAARANRDGTAITIVSAPRTARAQSAVSWRAGGNSTPGR